MLNIVIIVLAVIIVTLFIVTKLVLNQVFGKRCEGNSNLKYFTADDFEELDSQKIEFKSDKNQILRGFIYTNKNIKEYKGIIVFVHGMGAGHLSYTTEINTLAKAGFMVIGYDNTGTCTSEGNRLKGFFQSVIDLKYALKYINEDNILNKYPLSLMGHSWGAYTVCQELQYDSNVKAVVAMSGFNNASQIICDSMKDMTKKNFIFLKPFITAWNIITFGKDGIKNTVDILNKTEVPVLILQGDSDTSVALSNSLVSKELEEKANIKTILYKEKNHNVYQTLESEKYVTDTFAEIRNIGKKYKGKIPKEECEKLYGAIDYKKITEEDREVMDTIIKFIEGKVVEKV